MIANHRQKVRGEIPSKVFDLRYEVRIARTSAEVATALRLRHEVFNVELGSQLLSPDGIEFDEYDLGCEHLLVLDRSTGKTVGTYRLNTSETAGSTAGFYSASEFAIEGLPDEVIMEGIEVGRACIAKEHRNSRVLFLLWKGLLQYLRDQHKRYFFGCCSLFTRDEGAGRAAYQYLRSNSHLSSRFSIRPKRCEIAISTEDTRGDVPLPSLFEMYLRLGAEVCGPPMIDAEFGTIDFFVVFDIDRMSDRYRRMFS